MSAREIKVQVLFTVAIILTIMIATNPAIAQSIWVQMPFNGRWDKNCLASPDNHRKFFPGADWSTDIFESEDTNVRLRYGHNFADGIETFVLFSGNACDGADAGQAVQVIFCRHEPGAIGDLDGCISNGRGVGFVSYTHLKNVTLSQGDPISNFGKVGEIGYYSSSQCYAVSDPADAHVHVEMGSFLDGWCFADLCAGAELSAGDTIGMIGGASCTVGSDYDFSVRDSLVPDDLGNACAGDARVWIKNMCNTSWSPGEVRLAAAATNEFKWNVVSGTSGSRDRGRVDLGSEVGRCETVEFSFGLEVPPGHCMYDGEATLSLQMAKIDESGEQRFGNVESWDALFDLEECPLSNSCRACPIPFESCGPEPLVDITFVIDTTGSMWDDIAQVKTAAGEIVDAVAQSSWLYRVAITDFRDKPEWPYGGSQDYLFYIGNDFSDDPAAIISAIYGLSLGWGADLPESVYSGLMAAIEGHADDYGNQLSPWRQDAVKIIILLGDAPPHLPYEPWWPFYDLQDVLDAAATGGNQAVTADVMGHEEDVIPIRIYSIHVGGNLTARSYFRQLAEGSGGKLFLAPTASDVVDAILEILGDVQDPPENSPPNTDGASPSVSQLWPPNHKMMSVEIHGVVDPDGDPFSITITGITQDEPVKGPRKNSPDAGGVGTESAWLRAERGGNGNGGRVYRISFTATDDKGASSSGFVQVCVPHDQGVNTVCIDDGQVYDSTVE